MNKTCSPSLRLAVSKTPQFRVPIARLPPETTPRAFSTMTSNSHLDATSESFHGWSREISLPPGLLFGAMLGATAVYESTRDASPFSSFKRNGVCLCEEEKREVKIVQVSGDCEDMMEEVDLSNAEEIPVLREIIQFAETNHPDSLFLCMFYEALGEALRIDGKLEESIREYRKAEALLSRVAPESFDMVTCYILIGRGLLKLNGNLEEATKEFKKAEALAKRVSTDSSELIAFYLYLGESLHNHGFFAEATEEYRKLEAIAKRLDLSDFTGLAYLRIAWALSEHGNSDAALREYRLGLDFLQQKCVQEDAAVAHLLIGWELHKVGDSQGAVVEYREAVKIVEKTMEPGDIQLGRMYNAVGLFMLEANNLEEALKCFSSAMEIVAHLAPDSLEEAACHYNIGIVLSAQNDFEGALCEFRNALAIYESKARGSLDEANAHDKLGYVLEVLGQSEEAPEERRRASAIRQSKGNDHRPDEGIRTIIAQVLLMNKPLVTVKRCSGACP